MTERTLLLRTANEGRYCILATDFPSARVFDTATSRLACVVEPAPRKRASLATLSLTSVALGSCGVHGGAGGERSGDQTAARVAVATPDARALAAVGLSDGTVLIHDIARDESLGHVSVSATQQAVVAMSIRMGYLFCLTANHMLYVCDVSTESSIACGVMLKLQVQQDASAIAVHVETESKGDGGRRVFHVLVAGPTYTLFRVELHRRSAGGERSTEDGGRRTAAEKLLAFASQGTAVDYAWLGVAREAPSEAAPTSAFACVTASADEGVIRVWDMSWGSDDHTRGVGRCRRTLLCGQRIANVSLLDLTQDHKSSSAKGGSGGAVYVLATTFTGSVLLWNLGDHLLPRIVEPAPLPPAIAFLSSAPSARLLYGVLLRGGDGAAGGLALASSDASAAFGDAGPSLLLMRGKFALPQFEFASVQRLLKDQDTRLNGASASASSRGQQLKRLREAAGSMGLGISPSLTIVEVPCSTEAAAVSAQHAQGAAGLHDAAGNAFDVMDTAWALHQQRLAVRALMTPTESFAATHTYQAPSVKDLPVKQLTLEQRLRALSVDVARSAASRAAAALRSRQPTEGDEDGGKEEEVDGVDGVDDATASARTLPSLGLATVPLYQALHAKDVSAVMELLSVAARSPEGMRSTVLSLQLPYVLQLISVLSERLSITSAKSAVVAAKGDRQSTVGGAGGLAAVSTRSPLLLWLDTILHLRGTELYAAQLNGRKAKNENWKRTEADAPARAPGPEEEVSPPKDFLAPILHQYRSMCAVYDKLASLHGRLSVFHAVRPSERNQFVNRPRKMLSSNIELARTPAALSGKLSTQHIAQDDDILFPVMFTELRTRQGPHVVRVRSKLAKQRQQKRVADSDRALLRRAEKMANATRPKKPSDNIDDATVAEALGMDGSEMGALALTEEPGDGVDAEALGLSSNSGAEDDDDYDDEDDDDEEEEEEEEDEEEEEGGSGRRKHARTEGRKSRRGRTTTTEMLADVPSSLEGEDKDNPDADLDSSDAGADFAPESDDDVHSQILDFSHSDEEETSDDDDDESSASGSGDDGPMGRSAPDQGEDDSGSSEEDDEGMGEDMVELLASGDDDNATEEAKLEQRKHKRVRTD